MDIGILAKEFLLTCFDKDGRLNKIKSAHFIKNNRVDLVEFSRYLSEKKYLSSLGQTSVSANAFGYRITNAGREFACS